MLTDNEKNSPSKTKKLVSEKYKLLQFVLYGSKATGNDTEESDIDLMIKLEEETIAVRWDIYKMVAGEIGNRDVYFFFLIYSTPSNPLKSAS